MIRRRLTVRTIESYVETNAIERMGYQLGALLAPMSALPWVRTALRAPTELLPEGFDAEDVAREGHSMVLEIEDVNRTRLIDWRWETPNVYQLTAQLVVAVAAKVASGNFSGWRTPAEVLKEGRPAWEVASGALRGCSLDARYARWRDSGWEPTGSTRSPPLRGQWRSPCSPATPTRSRSSVDEHRGPDRGASRRSMPCQPRPDVSCRIGFANGAQASTLWRDLGFPLVDAKIVHEADGTLRVSSPFFADPETMQYGREMLAISGLKFDEDPAGESLVTRYDQWQDGPDFAAPATSILRKPVRWEPRRTKVKAAANVELDLGLALSRCPNLVPFTAGQRKFTSVWTGVLEMPAWPPAYSNLPPTRANRADAFGLPAFRFDDVEVIGYRIDLRDVSDDFGDKLRKLIEPLNFHVARNAVADFRYLPATSTLLIELLRYGKMRLKVPDAPLNVVDYQSQHELLVRVLVGRIDDDTAQARDPAVFVPAIFVDNPWSKILGREVQGFDKHMAEFAVYKSKGRPTLPLRPDGRVHENDEPRPLTDVARVSLVRTNGAHSPGPPILDLKYASGITGTEAFENFDLELALGGSALALTRWRQNDFIDADFRRSFARAAVKRTLKGFRSIQVSPVGERQLEKTWVTGTFAVDDTVRVARPSGVANLTFHADPQAPKGWLQTCELLGIPAGESDTLPFPAGAWYRMRCSMDLTIDRRLE